MAQCLLRGDAAAACGCSRPHLNTQEAKGVLSLGQPGLHGGFQASQGCTGRPCLKKIKKKLILVFQVFSFHRFLSTYTATFINMDRTILENPRKQVAVERGKLTGQRDRDTFCCTFPSSIQCLLPIFKQIQFWGERQ